MRIIFHTIVILGLAFGLGIWSVDWTSAQFVGFDSLVVDNWTAHPDAGNPDSDAYSRAYIARRGEVPLGAAEGVRFIRAVDNNSAPLVSTCDYVISGEVQSARAWLLSARPKNKDGAVSKATLLASSFGTVFESDGRFVIALSETPKTGNWVRLSTDEPFQLELVLLDTTIGSGTGLSLPSMPSIEKGRCRAG